MIQDLESLSREELIKRLQLNAELSQVVDGLWFISVEKDSNFDKALDMDIDVWKNYVHVSKKRIQKYFNISSTGLAAVKDFLEYDPWLKIEIQEQTSERLVFQITKCPGLEAMEKMGRDMLTCDPVEIEYFNELIETINPAIKIIPLKLPPRQSADDICCKWLFTLENEDQ
jgi:hypothetical protein